MVEPLCLKWICLSMTVCVDARVLFMLAICFTIPAKGLARRDLDPVVDRRLTAILDQSKTSSSAIALDVDHLASSHGLPRILSHTTERTSSFTYYFLRESGCRNCRRLHDTEHHLATVLPGRMIDRHCCSGHCYLCRLQAKRVGRRRCCSDAGKEKRQTRF